MKNIQATAPAPRRRGRPHKFGRAARVIALTLPADVIDWLTTLNPDPGRAIVNLFEAARGQSAAGGVPRSSEPDIVEVGARRGLILVDPVLVRGLPGVAVIPFAGGRAFLALEPGQRVADLELAVIDVLERGETLKPDHRAALTTLRTRLRQWRTDPTLRFHERSIIVVERVRARGRGRRGGPVGTLAGA